MTVTKLQRALVAQRERHAENWRRWACELAEGGQGPLPLDLVETAAALGITDPGAAIESDAAVVRELTDAEEAIALCRATDAATLAPWSGSVERLRVAAIEAHEEARRLNDLLAGLGMTEVFWQSQASRLRRSAPRLFPSMEDTK